MNELKNNRSDSDELSADHCVFFPVIEGVSNFEYVKAIGSVLGSSYIHSIYRYKDLVKIYLKSKSHVSEVLKAGVNIKGYKPSISDKRVQCTITLVKVDPAIPDTFIEKLLQSYGILKSSFTREKLSNHDEFSHIVSSEIRIIMDMFPGICIPDSLKFVYEGIPYEIHIQVEKQTCLENTSNNYECEITAPSCSNGEGNNYTFEKTYNDNDHSYIVKHPFLSCDSELGDVYKSNSTYPLSSENMISQIQYNTFTNKERFKKYKPISKTKKSTHKKAVNKVISENSFVNFNADLILEEDHNDEVFTHLKQNIDSLFSVNSILSKQVPILNCTSTPEKDKEIYSKIVTDSRRRSSRNKTCEVVPNRINNIDNACPSTSKDINCDISTFVVDQNLLKINPLLHVDPCVKNFNNETGEIVNRKHKFHDMENKPAKRRYSRQESVESNSSVKEILDVNKKYTSKSKADSQKPINLVNSNIATTNSNAKQTHIPKKRLQHKQEQMHRTQSGRKSQLNTSVPKDSVTTNLLANEFPPVKQLRSYIKTLKTNNDEINDINVMSVKSSTSDNGFYPNSSGILPTSKKKLPRKRKKLNPKIDSESVEVLSSSEMFSELSIINDVIVNLTSRNETFIKLEPVDLDIQSKSNEDEGFNYKDICKSVQHIDDITVNQDKINLASQNLPISDVNMNVENLKQNSYISVQDRTVETYTLPNSEVNDINDLLDEVVKSICDQLVEEQVKPIEEKREKCASVTTVKKRGRKPRRKSTAIGGQLDLSKSLNSETKLSEIQNSDKSTASAFKIVEVVNNNESITKNVLTVAEEKSLYILNELSNGSNTTLQEEVNDKRNLLEEVVKSNCDQQVKPIEEKREKCASVTTVKKRGRKPRRKLTAIGGQPDLSKSLNSETKLSEIQNSDKSTASAFKIFEVVNNNESITKNILTVAEEKSLYILNELSNGSNTTLQEEVNDKRNLLEEVVKSNCDQQVKPIGEKREKFASVTTVKKRGRKPRRKLTAIGGQPDLSKSLNSETKLSEIQNSYKSTDSAFKVVNNNESVTKNIPTVAEEKSLYILNELSNGSNTTFQEEVNDKNLLDEVVKSICNQQVKPMVEKGEKCASVTTVKKRGRKPRRKLTAIGGQPDLSKSLNSETKLSEIQNSDSSTASAFKIVEVVNNNESVTKNIPTVAEEKSLYILNELSNGSNTTLQEEVNDKNNLLEKVVKSNCDQQVKPIEEKREKCASVTTVKKRGRKPRRKLTAIGGQPDLSKSLNSETKLSEIQNSDKSTASAFKIVEVVNKYESVTKNIPTVAEEKSLYILNELSNGSNTTLQEEVNDKKNLLEEVVKSNCDQQVKPIEEKRGKCASVTTVKKRGRKPRRKLTAIGGQPDLSKSLNSETKLSEIQNSDKSTASAFKVVEVVNNNESVNKNIPTVAEEKSLHILNELSNGSNTTLQEEGNDKKNLLDEVVKSICDQQVEEKVKPVEKKREICASVTLVKKRGRKRRRKPTANEDQLDLSKSLNSETKLVEIQDSDKSTDSAFEVVNNNESVTKNIPTVAEEKSLDILNKRSNESYKILQDNELLDLKVNVIKNLLDEVLKSVCDQQVEEKVKEKVKEKKREICASVTTVKKRGRKRRREPTAIRDQPDLSKSLNSETELCEIQNNDKSSDSAFKVVKVVNNSESVTKNIPTVSEEKPLGILNELSNGSNTALQNNELLDLEVNDIKNLLDEVVKSVCDQQVKPVEKKRRKCALMTTGQKRGRKRRRKSTTIVVEVVNNIESVTKNIPTVAGEKSLDILNELSNESNKTLQNNELLDLQLSPVQNEYEFENDIMKECQEQINDIIKEIELSNDVAVCNSEEKLLVRFIECAEEINADSSQNSTQIVRKAENICHEKSNLSIGDFESSSHSAVNTDELNSSDYFPQADYSILKEINNLSSDKDCFKKKSSNGSITSLLDDTGEETDFGLPANTISEIESYLLADLPNDAVQVPLENNSEDNSQNENSNLKFVNKKKEEQSSLKKSIETSQQNSSFSVDEQVLSLQLPIQKNTSIEFINKNLITKILETQKEKRSSVKKLIETSELNSPFNMDEQVLNLHLPTKRNTLEFIADSPINSILETQNETNCDLENKEFSNIKIADVICNDICDEKMSSLTGTDSLLSTCDSILNLVDEGNLNDSKNAEVESDTNELKIKISSLSSLSDQEPLYDSGIPSICEQNETVSEIIEMPGETITIKQEYCDSPPSKVETIEHSISALKTKNKAKSSILPLNKAQHSHKKVAAVNGYLKHIFNRKFRNKKLANTKSTSRVFNALSDNSASVTSPYDFHESQEELTSFRDSKNPSSFGKPIKKPMLPCVVLFKDKNNLRDKWHVKMRLRDNDSELNTRPFKAKRSNGSVHKARCKINKSTRNTNSHITVNQNVPALKIKVRNVPHKSTYPSSKHNFSIEKLNFQKGQCELDTPKDVEIVPTESASRTPPSVPNDEHVISNDVPEESNDLPVVQLDTFNKNVPCEDNSQDSSSNALELNSSPTKLNTKDSESGRSQFFETFVVKSVEVKPVYEDIYSTYPNTSSVSDSDDGSSLTNFPLHKEALVKFLNDARHHRNPRAFALKVLSKNKTPGSLRALVLQLYGYYKICRNKKKRLNISRLIRVLDDRYARR